MNLLRRKVKLSKLGEIMTTLKMMGLELIWGPELTFGKKNDTNKQRGKTTTKNV